MVLKYIIFIVFLVKIQENNNLTRCKINKKYIYIKSLSILMLIYKHDKGVGMVIEDAKHGLAIVFW